MLWLFRQSFPTEIDIEDLRDYPQDHPEHFFRVAGVHLVDQYGLDSRQPERTGRVQSRDLTRCAVIIVPIIEEELFWRLFLLRYLINSGSFTKVAIGSFSLFSFVRQLPYFSAWNITMFSPAWSRDNFQLHLLCHQKYCRCVLSHSVANLGLSWIRAPQRKMRASGDPFFLIGSRNTSFS